MYSNLVAPSQSNRIKELCDRFGLEIYEGALDELLKRNKLAVSSLINKIPSERISFEDYIDDDGHGYGCVLCSLRLWWLIVMHCSPWKVAWSVFSITKRMRFFNSV